LGRRTGTVSVTVVVDRRATAVDAVELPDEVPERVIGPDVAAFSPGTVDLA
jgi:hypothetical protein